jgi:hypothetical protein
MEESVFRIADKTTTQIESTIDSRSLLGTFKSLQEHFAIGLLDLRELTVLVQLLRLLPVLFLICAIS